MLFTPLRFSCSDDFVFLNLPAQVGEFFVCVGFSDEKKSRIDRCRERSEGRARLMMMVMILHCGAALNEKGRDRLEKRTFAVFCVVCPSCAKIEFSTSSDSLHEKRGLKEKLQQLLVTPLAVKRDLYLLKCSIEELDVP